MLGQLGLYGEESVVAEAKKRLLAHVSNTVTLPADLRSPVYKTVVSQADEKTFEQMLKVRVLCLSVCFSVSLQDDVSFNVLDTVLAHFISLQIHNYISLINFNSIHTLLPLN